MAAILRLYVFHASIFNFNRFMKILLLFFLIGFISCNNNKEPKRVVSPPGYEFQDPIVVKLPLELDEISGLAYYAPDKSIFAISDEKGKLFKITPFSHPYCKLMAICNKS